MNTELIEKITRFVADNIGDFHNARVKKIKSLKLNEVLKRRNPYLYKVKNLEIVNDLVKVLIDDHLTQSERTQFGAFLERLAVFIARELYGGGKTGSSGSDLEFKRGDLRYIVSIKSGPNWGNASQVKQQEQNFKSVAKIIRQNQDAEAVMPILGFCYGNVYKDRGSYQIYGGQKFWEFLSGDDRLYLDIIKPLGHEAKKRNDLVAEEYSKQLNKFTAEFSNRFCDNGKINWEAIVRFNSEYRAGRAK